MKKTKQPGDNISLKTKKSENQAIMDWINAQSNLMDSLRYLIELEVHRYGVRNLQAHVPMERNVLGGAEGVGVAAGAAAYETAASAEGAQAGARAEDLEPESGTGLELPPEDEIDDDDIEAWT
ncbi:hypothetical protein ACFO9Q_20300 [Paenibacillus sp. GCM10023252]|uniref:hypothetical protein n=1 Tax=Paenibacillus sp. GCM10023252 TaxID=3252649 RepID=UPI003620635B